MTERVAIGYVRVSTAEQVNGFGLDVQRRAIRDHCRRLGHRLDRVLGDEGISGSNGLAQRPGLSEALSLIETHQAEVLVVYRMDRLARNLLLQETVISRLQAAGADVVSVTEPDMGGDDPTRVLIRQVVGAIAQYERAVIRGRMMAGRAAKAARAGYAGGRPPLGYVARSGELVGDEDEQETVRLIWRLRSEGLSLREIGQRLDAAGRRTKSGGRWHPATVRRVLIAR